MTRETQQLRASGRIYLMQKGTLEFSHVKPSTHPVVQCSSVQTLLILPPEELSFIEEWKHINISKF